MQVSFQDVKQLIQDKTDAFSCIETNYFFLIEEETTGLSLINLSRRTMRKLDRKKLYKINFKKGGQLEMKKSSCFGQ